MGTRHAGALVDDVLAEAVQARHRADEADLRERLLDRILGHAQCVGHGQAADVVLQQRMQQLRHLAAQAFTVTGGREQAALRSRRHPTAQETSSSPIIALFFIILPFT